VSGKKTVSLLVIALALGAAGAGLSMLYLKAREADLIEALKPKSQPIPVVVAAKDLVKGDKLNTSTLSVREIPSDYVDPNAIRPAQFEEIEGLVLTENLASGKPLLKSFIDREYPLDFSDTIELKRRAMTIQVDETNTISGLIRPGNRIDLFVNMPASAGNDDGSGNQIMPVVENIEVLATGRHAAKDYEEKVRLLRAGLMAQPDQNFTNLTLNVTPKQAALIELAQDKGDLLALLRNRKDDSASGFVTVSADTVSENAQALAAAAAVKATYKPVGKLSVNENGDVVDANGNVLTGVKLNEDGTVTLPDGTRVNPDEIVVDANGQVRMKNGDAIAGVEAVKSLGKLTVNENGDVVDANGNILTGVKLNEDGTVTLPDGTKVDPKDIVIGADGQIRMKNGDAIEGVEAVKSVGELTTNANGDVVDANGNIITGVKLNPDGTVTLPDGTTVAASDIVVGADGQLQLKNGKKIEGASMVKPVGELSANAAGNVMDANGNVLAGLTMNADGTVTLPDGRKVKADDIVVNADGSVSLKSGEKLEGVKLISPAEAAAYNFEVDYIVGGVSEDSVATVNKLTVDEETAEPVIQEVK
jgi:pilus assembly protein CpaB